MRIDQLNVALRSRNPWEAFDLGIALARNCGRNLYLAFALPYLAFALLVNLLTWGNPTVAVLLIWWVKPAFDRIALYVAAQSVFGATPAWRATLKNLPHIPRTGLAYALTLGRFDFARSFHLAVFQLEGQTGAARRERITVLDRSARSPAVWLTVVVIHFAYVLLFGLDGLLKMISPEGLHFSLQLGEYFSFGERESSLVSQYLFNVSFALIECVLEPLYITAGFSLYLSRRTVLEGWDLEVAFKRMTARIAAAGAAAKILGFTFMLGVLLQGLPGTAAWAQDASAQILPGPANTPNNDAAGPSAEKRMIEEILGGPEFAQYEDRQVWRRKNAAKEMEDAEPKVGNGWLVFARYLAEAMRAVAWVLAIVFIGWLLYYLSQRLGWFKDLITQPAIYKPDVLFGLDLRAESLPVDIPAAARGLLAQGEMRAALSLLYRGALRVLIHERALDVREGDTEGDCVRRVSVTMPGALADYFRRLVEAWALLAYARRAPEDTSAQSLVEDWAHHFAPRSGNTPA